MKVFAFVFLLSFSVCAQQPNFKIAQNKSGAIVFVKDTVALKEYFSQFVNDSLLPNKLSFDSMKILQGNLLGALPDNYNKSYYYLICRDVDNKLKYATTVYKQGDDFFLYYSNQQLSEEENEVGLRYLVCHGADEDCYPYLWYEEGKLRWSSISREIFYCDPNDPCKTTSGLLQL